MVTAGSALEQGRRGEGVAGRQGERSLEPGGVGDLEVVVRGRRVVGDVHADERVGLAPEELLDGGAHQARLVAVGREGDQLGQPLGRDVEVVGVEVGHR